MMLYSMEKKTSLNYLKPLELCAQWIMGIEFLEKRCKQTHMFVHKVNGEERWSARKKLIYSKIMETIIKKSVKL